MTTDSSQHVSTRSAGSEPLPSMCSAATDGYLEPAPPLLVKRCLIGLIGLIGLMSAPMPLAQSAQRSSDQAVSVRYAQVRQGAVQDRLRALGMVVASRSAVVASEVAGLVQQISVRPGTRVRKGQELARLRSRPLELRLAAALGELKEAEARLRSSELRLERLQTLADSEVVSPQIVDDARYESEAGEGLVARLSAEVERLRDELAHGVLRAPFDGTVVVEKTQVGQWLDVGDPVVEMVSLDKLEARLDIPENRYGALEPGTDVRVTSEAGAGAGVVGRLRAVVPQASDRAHTFPAYVSLPEDTDLAIGMLIHGELTVSVSQPGVWVPKDALIGLGETRSLFVMSTDFSVHRSEVKVGAVEGVWQQVEATSGAPIKAGDFVVTHGNEQLREGEQVRAVRQDYPVR